MTTTPFFFFSSHQNFGTSAIHNTCPPIQFLYCILSWKSKATPMLQFRTRTNVRLTRTRSVYWCGNIPKRQPSSVKKNYICFAPCDKIPGFCTSRSTMRTFNSELSEPLRSVWRLTAAVGILQGNLTLAPAICVGHIFM